MGTKNNRAIGYRRLSDKDQSKYSLEYQERAIREYCNRYQLEIIALYTDNGECSDTFDRPDYRALERFIKEHKGAARYLIIMDHDRFSRNLIEALAKIDELEDRFNIKVLASNEEIDLDTKDPSVFMRRAFSYLMANQELLRIRKRTRDGIRQAQRQGRYVNHAPYGYTNARDEHNRSILKVNDAQVEVVRMIFGAYLNGTPLVHIYQLAKEKGFSRKGNSAIMKILGNCLYAGLVKVNGDRRHAVRYVPGLHQPIISEENFWRVQERLGKRCPIRTQPQDRFPLRGILCCWCGQYMTAAFSKGKNRSYLYYWCTRHRSINLGGEKLHQQFEELLAAFRFSPDLAKQIYERADVELKESTKSNEQLILVRTKQVLEIEKKLEKLEEKYIEENIDKDTYYKWKERYGNEISLLSTEISNRNHNGYKKKAQQLAHCLQAITDLKEICRIASPHKRQSLLRLVFKSKLTYLQEMGGFRTKDLHITFRERFKANALLLVGE